ncbi:MAG TPA: hypothetical protein VNS09_04075 [Solirubrobacter sp.]|nr:hypothetical protein [Solirubrobacter sp.]
MRRLALLVVVPLLAACGGQRQDADEPAGTFKVEVVDAVFPHRQHIAEPVELRVRVRNADRRTLDNVAVTVETRPRPGNAAVAFGQGTRDPRLADSARPIWVLAEGPRGGDVASVNTWSAGRLGPGESRELVWKLVASRAGRFTLGYRVAPGLTGKARAAAGGRAAGTFTVTIADTPVPARVGADGEVVRGDAPARQR